MKKSRISAAALSALLCLGCFCGCNKNDESSGKSSEKESAPIEMTSENANKPSEKDSDASGEKQEEIIVPDEDSDEYDLGSYRISPNGIKLYYEDSEYPPELIETLEKYFLSFSTGDFASYKECIFPSYIDTMENYLQKNFQYGLEKSFQTQCDNLSVNMGGSFEITRIKAEKPIEVESEEAGAEEFLDNLDSFFGQDYKESVKNDCDALRYMTFSIMAKDADENESLLVSSFYILFAEKDGKYYTFG